MSFLTSASDKAGKLAAYAAAQQEKFLRQQLAELQGYQQPFIGQGQQAFGLYQALTGAQGPQAQQAALANFQMSQPAQFGLQQQLKGLQQNAAATGQLFGGNRLMEEQALGTQAYQQDLANYIERLRAQAAMGQQAVNTFGQLGTGVGQGIAGAISGIGSAKANAALAGQQAQAGMAGNVMGLFGSALGALGGGA